MSQVAKWNRSPRDFPVSTPSLKRTIITDGSSDDHTAVTLSTTGRGGKDVSFGGTLILYVKHIARSLGVTCEGTDSGVGSQDSHCLAYSNGIGLQGNGLVTAGKGTVSERLRDRLSCGKSQRPERGSIKDNNGLGHTLSNSYGGSGKIAVYVSASMRQAASGAVEVSGAMRLPHHRRQMSLDCVPLHQPARPLDTQGPSQGNL